MEEKFNEGDIVECIVWHVTGGGPMGEMIIEKGDLVRIVECVKGGFGGEMYDGTCMSDWYDNYRHTDRPFPRKW